jgi:gluconolactonase
MKPAIPLAEFESFAEGLDHPEGLAFDAGGDLWAGGEAGQIYRIDRRGRVREVGKIGGFCLGLTFSACGELWVCNLGRHALLRLDRKGRVLASYERAAGRKLRTPNFSVFDSAGNLYFSDSGEWRQDDGFIYRLRPNGKFDQIGGPLAFPNGLSLSADERWLYVVQSTRDNVVRIELKPDGSAGRPRVFARGLARVPDGCAFDAAGNLYVTCYASDNVYRVSPRGKVSLFAYDPAGTMIARPTNAAFRPGSDSIYLANLGRWHICRARIGIEGQPLAHQHGVRTRRFHENR